MHAEPKINSMPDKFGNPLVFLHRNQALSECSDGNVGGKTERISDCRVSRTAMPLTIVETSRFNSMTKLLNYKAKLILGTLDIAKLTSTYLRRIK